jgi:hypothetical protein
MEFLSLNRGKPSLYFPEHIVSSPVEENKAVLWPEICPFRLFWTGDNFVVALLSSERGKTGNYEG